MYDVRFLKSYFINPKSTLGFSLIELIVVVAIISVLFVGLAILFNPFAQLQKAHNATRQQDITQMRSALDAYYNDKGCYPTSLSFGAKWSSGTTVYMQKIPQDPDCSGTNPTYCYDYQTDGSNCPQWNILYATMHQPISSGISTCAVVTTSNCLPTSSIFTYNYCAVSGKLDCSYLSGHALPTPVAPGGNNGGGGGGGGGGFNCNGQISACSNGVCDVESSNQCVQCGGSMQCYQDLNCGGISCQ